MVSASLRQFKLALIWLIALAMVNSNSSAQPKKSHALTNTNEDCVVLLHGLARSKYSMKPLERALKKQYKVINLGYPSRSGKVEQLATAAIKPALAQCGGAARVHFVTHSLGGILLREFLTGQDIENLGHVVMLGPPNHGSELVDYFQSKASLRWLFNTANGPAGQQLGTQGASITEQLGAADFSLGIIAGNVSLSPIFSRIIEGEDDGKVSVKSSKLEGMSDHIVVPSSHTFIMRNQEVIEQVQHFLKHGKFSQATSED